jgi:tRNA threonylcarbamoyladenosine biosynthesis protein TsaB
MAFILNIETATENCSVCLSENDKLIFEKSEINTQRHSEIITIWINEVLAESGISYNQLDAVSISEGPGSYTSLRVGTSAAKAICYAHDLPLISVNTLKSLISNEILVPLEKYYFFPMIDARRMEVYASLYDNKLNTIFDNKPIILDDFDLSEFISNEDIIVLSGNGSEKAKLIFSDKNYIFSGKICQAENLIFESNFKFQQKQFEDIAYFSPNYIKPANITIPVVKH